MKYTMSCGCEVEITKDTLDATIFYCPKHAAGAEPLELNAVLKWLEQEFTWWRLECESSNIYRVIGVLMNDYEVVDVFLRESEDFKSLIQDCMKQVQEVENERKS